MADPRVTAIEDAWADMLFAEARDDESEDHDERLLERIAAAPRVSTLQKQRAIEQLVALDRRELKPVELGVPGLAPSAVAAGNVPDARAVVRSFSPAFRRCFSDGLAIDPNASGTIRLTVTLGAAGEVLGVNSTSAGKLSPRVVKCVEDVTRAGRFGPPAGGGATLVIPLTFASQ